MEEARRSVNQEELLAAQREGDAEEKAAAERRAEEERSEEQADGAPPLPARPPTSEA